MALLDEARATSADTALIVEIDELAGHIATHRGPVMRGHAILDRGGRAGRPRARGGDALRGGRRLFLRGRPGRDAGVAERARAALGSDPSPRARSWPRPRWEPRRSRRRRGGRRGSLTRRSRSPRGRPALRDDLKLSPGWPPARSSCASGRRALAARARAGSARARAAVGALPFVLNLIARDLAGADRWAVAEATYREAIDLARESGQQTELALRRRGARLAAGAARAR